MINILVSYLTFSYGVTSGAWPQVIRRDPDAISQKLYNLKSGFKVSSVSCKDIVKSRSIQDFLMKIRTTGGETALDPAGQLRDDYIRSHPAFGDDNKKLYFAEMWEIEDWRTIASNAGSTTSPQQGIALLAKVGHVCLFVFH